MAAYLKVAMFFIFLKESLKCSKPENEHFCSIDMTSCSDSTNKKLLLNKYVESNFDNQILTKINSLSASFIDCPFTNCSCYIDVLRSDLYPFRNGITKSMINSIRSKGVTYIVYEKKLFRDKDCLFPSRCAGVEYFLKQLLPKLKNTELIINTRDWPQISRHFPLFGPVLSFSKTDDYLDIMYPAWSFWEGGPAIKTYPTGLGRWDLHRKSLSVEFLKWPWDKKKSMGFFRGSRTSDKRDMLILLSRKRPDLIDAQYTKNQAWKSSDDTLGKTPAEVVSLEYHCQYKYLFNFRGVAASFRFKHLFLCGSLVIHVGTEWIEFFYPALKPWIHYIPLSENASEEDIVKLILFLQNHEKIAHEIAKKGQEFIIKHLSLKEVKCYWKNLLKNYKKLLKYNVTLDNSLVEIK